MLDSTVSPGAITSCHLVTAKCVILAQHSTEFHVWEQLIRSLTMQMFQQLCDSLAHCTEI